MLSPLQLRRHFYNKVVIKSVENPTTDSNRFHVEFELGISQEADKNNCFQLSFQFRFGGNPKMDARPPYEGEIEVVGIFMISEDFPTEKIEKLLKFNGGAILMGAVREMFWNVTSRGAHGPVELPIFNAEMFLNIPQS